MRVSRSLTTFLPVALMTAIAFDAFGEVSIVGNAGPFESIRAAATGEASVDWNDADKADDTACTEGYAAVELQHYLRKMTGAATDFALVDDDALPAGDLVVVGGPSSNKAAARFGEALGVAQADLDALGPEGYRIKSGTVEGRHILLIAGGGRVGTLYGVYDFLYRQGCRWFAPGEVHEEIPEIDFAAMGEMDITETPDFFMRGFHAWEDRGNDDFLVWMARNRLNYWCVDEDNHPFLRKLGLKLVWGGHVIGYNYLKPGDPYPYKHASFKDGNDLPEDPYPVSPDYLGDENNDGKLTYREAHPEWYGMNAEGERVKTLRNGDYNYCTSNPDATRELMKNAVQQLIDGEARDAEIVNCWTVDAGKWCTCEACKALGSQTDRNLLFVYAFDKAVKEAQAAGRINRPITLLFLAYADVLEPPTKPLPADFDYDTCIATYFPIVRNYGRCFDDPECPKNSSYAKHLVGWATDPDRHYRGQICIGEYYNVSGYKCLPICFMTTMANDIPYYYDKANARYFHYMHVTTDRWGNKALTNYQMARQIWDEDTDCEALWQDYFAKRYGDAAKYMRPFYSMLEVMLSNCSEMKYALAPRLAKGANNLFPSVYMRYEPGDDCINMSWTQIMAACGNARTLIDKAMSVDVPDRIKARLAEDEEAFVYGERTVRFYDAIIRAYQQARAGDEDTARKAFAEALRLADLLRQDTASVSVSSSHANDRNALSASRAQGALARLTELLGPPVPEETPLVTLGRKPVVFTGRQFAGGGGVLHGYGLHVFPGRIPVSDDGNYMYAASAAPHDRIAMYFRLDEAPKGDVAVKWFGLRCPEPPGSAVPGRVTVNDAEVFAGDVPFAEDKLSEAAFTIPAGALKKGMNRIVIQNTAPKGPPSGRPWFGIDRVELATP